jgi:hypothetical protein
MQTKIVNVKQMYIDVHADTNISTLPVYANINMYVKGLYLALMVKQKSIPTMIVCQFHSKIPL